MSLRKIPIMLSFLTTVALLFGGWFLYEQLEVKEPLKKEVAQMNSAQLTDLQVKKNQITLKLTVIQPDLFPEEYRALLRQIEKRVQNKQLDIQFGNQDERLKAIWMEGQFAIQEAMELHQYSKIPQLLNEWKTAYGLDAAQAKMDDSTIYVYMKSGDHDFYTLIPRNPDTREVKVHA